MAGADINTLYPLILKSNSQEKMARTSLVVQWLRLNTPNAGGSGSILGQGTRSLMVQPKFPMELHRSGRWWQWTSLAVQWLGLSAFTARLGFEPWLWNQNPVSCITQLKKKKSQWINGTRIQTQDSPKSRAQGLYPIVCCSPRTMRFKNLSRINECVYMCF